MVELFSSLGSWMPASRRLRNLVMVQSTKLEMGRAMTRDPVKSRRKVKISPSLILESVKMIRSRAAQSGAKDTEDGAGGRETLRQQEAPVSGTRSKLDTRVLRSGCGADTAALRTRSTDPVVATTTTSDDNR